LSRADRSGLDALIGGLDSGRMSVAVENARQEWEESHRRLEAEAADPDRYERLLAHVETVSAELRRRVGETFTLAELADAYARADEWARDAVAESDPGPGWPRTLALVEGAAFHLYARGAVDYAP
jgi:hypothetical protein